MAWFKNFIKSAGLGIRDINIPAKGKFLKSWAKGGQNTLRNAQGRFSKLDFGIKLPTIENVNRLRRAGRITGAAAGGLLGGAVGGLPGAGIGAAVGGGGMFVGGKALKGAFFGSLKYPKSAFGIGLVATSIYSFTKPLIGAPLVNQKMNRSTNPAIPTTKIGPGFVPFGNSPRVRMPHNNIGATGDLTLSLHKLRHGR